MAKALCILDFPVLLLTAGSGGTLNGRNWVTICSREMCAGAPSVVATSSASGGSFCKISQRRSFSALLCGESSSESIVSESIYITSDVRCEGFVSVLNRLPKDAAVEGTGSGAVTDIGRCSEKKEERPISVS